MLKELSLVVKQVRQETHDVKSLILDLGEEEFDFQAGQYLLLNLDVNDPDGNSRALSIANSPTEKGILMVSTKLTGTPYKQKFDSLKEGDVVKIKGPAGKFTLIEDAKEIVFLGGGIGITPFRSLIKYSADKQIPSKMILLYANKTTDDIVYKDEWPLIAKQNPNFTFIHTVSEPPQSTLPWKGRIGRIDQNMVREYIKNINVPIYYICGPPTMLEAMVNMLKMMGVMDEKIKVERFAGY